jgi:hypothetical protein
MYLCGKLPFLCKFAICDLLSVVWFAAKIYRVEFYGKKPHGKNYTNGLNIKVCLVVDSFSRNLKSQFLIIKIDMSKILIIEDEAAIRRVFSKILSEESDTYQVEDAEDGVQGYEKKKITITILFCAI